MRYESLLGRWTYLLETILGLGIPNKVPLWEFWMRGLVMSPGIVVVVVWLTYSVARAIWFKPVAFGWFLFALWVLAGLCGAFLKIMDKGVENRGGNRDFIHFE